VIINHVHMGIYKITQGSYSDIVEYAQQRLAPFKRDVPGFVSYALTDVGEGRFVSISIWERREQADAAKSMVAEWVRSTDLADLVALEEDLIGEMRTLAAYVRDAV
jgi:heme-degrading monooxygenase HmoA